MRLRGRQWGGGFSANWCDFAASSSWVGNTADSSASDLYGEGRMKQQTFQLQLKTIINQNLLQLKIEDFQECTIWHASLVCLDVCTLTSQPKGTLVLSTRSKRVHTPVGALPWQTLIAYLYIQASACRSPILGCFFSTWSVSKIKIGPSCICLTPVVAVV